MSENSVRLGVNIDHVATIRNARGGRHPDPVRAALLAVQAGADGITAHLREDRRHITDSDIDRLMKELTVPLNLEMAVTEEMTQIALKHRPHACCLVPEKREEKTTEGGLDIARFHRDVLPVVERLLDAGIRVSLFIDPEPVQIAVAAAFKVPVVELHTGAYCEAGFEGNKELQEKELKRLQIAADVAYKAGLEVHAGHGLTFDNITPVAAIPVIKEFNIGHFLVGEAIFCGLEKSIQTMKQLIVQERQ